MPAKAVPLPTSALAVMPAKAVPPPAANAATPAAATAQPGSAAPKDKHEQAELLKELGKLQVVGNEVPWIE